MASRHQFRDHIRQLELQRLETRQRRAELLPLQHIGLGAVNSRLGGANGAGGNIDTTTVQAFHGDLKAITLFTQAVCHRHSHLLKADLFGWLAVPAHLFKILTETDAR